MPRDEDSKAHLQRRGALRGGHLLAAPAWLALVYLVVGAVWVFVSDRVVARTVTDGERVAELQTLKGWVVIAVTAALLYGLGAMLMMRLISTRSRLKEARRNFRRVLESSRDGMWCVDHAGRVTEANGRLVEILGTSKEELLREGMDRYLVPETFAAAGIPEEPRLVKFARADGGEGWGIVSSVPLVDNSGGGGWEARILTDVTRRKRAEEELRATLKAEQTLLSELDHRVRNNLASLLTLIDITRRGAQGVDEFARLIRGRVGTMAATHSLLAESKFRSVSLSRLLSVIIEGEQEQRVEREGPAVMLGPAQAGPMAMVLQEMWANSVKHGALGVEHGRVEVRWEMAANDDGLEVVRLTWRDKYGPAVRQPERPGFGLGLVRGLVQSDLRGRFWADFKETGAVLRVEFPLRGSPVQQNGAVAGEIVD